MELSIPDMSCGHCRTSVTEAVTRLDPAAKIEVDLAARRARLQTAAAPDAVIAALKDVGFAASLL